MALPALIFAAINWGEPVAWRGWAIPSAVAIIDDLGAIVIVALFHTEQPSESNWMQLLGVSLICGIGFTMSLFIGGLAFEGQDPSYELRVKLGVLCGSLLAATLGTLVLLKAAPRPQ